MGMLDKTVYSMLQNEPFYANMLLGAAIRYDDPRVKTAAVVATKQGVTFMLNTGFFSKLTPLQKIAVLKHEILQLLLLHCDPVRHN